jgi:hypothetical protein
MKKFISASILALICLSASSEEWKPAGESMLSRWAAEVDPRCPLPEYPRPQMVRSEWVNLNGLWDYRVTSHDSPQTNLDEGRILVPFAIESALSGVKRTFLPTEKLWYERTFTIPETWRGRRVILHFGAVDYSATVTVNGQKAGSHAGSSDAFSFDITDLLVPGARQQVAVEVEDRTDKGQQPRGKQVLKPRGIYYTAVSGIWKTVWMEPVDPRHIKSYSGVPDIDKGVFTITANVANADRDTRVRYTAYDGGRKVASAEVAHAQQAVLNIPDAKLWSPDTPFLYDLKMEVVSEGKTVDETDSYFGMRKISVAPDAEGVTRIMLNNRFVFQYGFLDQGWWPDGLLTAPTEEALLYDIEFTKNAGFNTIRKHIKIESDRFYYHCDRLGLLVWQDAVSGDNFNLKNMPEGVVKSEQSIRQFESELTAMIDQLRNYPSIVNWVVFNEGWGQYGGGTLIDRVKQYDPSRLVEVSGWVDMGNGDVCDIHRYPAPNRMEKAGEGRAFAVGEFGGLGLPVEGHLWNPEMRNWGYATYTDSNLFREAYRHLVFHIGTMIPEGLSAAIYTQTTDVEGEVNGMLTYDRAAVKIPAGELAAMHSVLYNAPPRLSAAVPDSSTEPQKWSYTTTRPAGEWFAVDYKTGSWKSGEGPFGYNHPLWQLGYAFHERGATAHLPREKWDSGEIWLRRSFDLSDVPAKPILRLRYDQHAEVWINGVKVADMYNRLAHYSHSDLIPLSEEGRKALKKGTNVIAVYCKRDKEERGPGNQIIDAGILEVE